MSHNKSYSQSRGPKFSNPGVRVVIPQKNKDSASLVTSHPRATQPSISSGSVMSTSFGWEGMVHSNSG